jgi:hypothetical protein
VSTLGVRLLGSKEICDTVCALNARTASLAWMSNFKFRIF